MPDSLNQIYLIYKYKQNYRWSSLRLIKVVRKWDIRRSLDIYYFQAKNDCAYIQDMLQTPGS